MLLIQHPDNSYTNFVELVTPSKSMSENHSSKALSYERNENGVYHPPSSQLSSLLAKEDNDWNLQQFLGIIQRQALVIVGITTVVMGVVAYVTLNQRPVYQSSFKLLVEPVNDDKNLNNLTPNNGSDKPNLDYESQIQVLKSPQIMVSIINQLQTLYPEINYNSLISSLAIRRLGETKIIEISYQSTDPKKIKVVLEEIANSYLTYSVEKRQTKLRQGVQFVEKQIPSIKNRVDKLQNKMQLFRQKYNFLSPEAQTQLISSQLNAVSTQRVTINQQLLTARATFSNLKGKDGELAALNNASLYQQLLTQMQQLEGQFALESARFQADNPVMETLKEKRQNLLPLLQQEARRIMGVKFADLATQINVLEVQNQELTKLEKRLRQQVNQLPVIARQYNELLRDLQISTESLNRFLTTRENLQIQIAKTELPWELIQAPFEPQMPISPDIIRNFIWGFFSSLALGIGAGLLREKIDTTYHTSQSVKDKLKLPLLGTLPFDSDIQNSLDPNYNSRKENKKIVSNKFSLRIPGLSKIFRPQSSPERYYGQGQFWESLQVLHANIQLLNSYEPIRSLVISSALPGDGKSTIAFELAQLATTMGKRVLLVDADLRRSNIHNLGNLNNLWGLSSLISTNMPMAQVIQQLPNINNLSIITAGPTSPDPARLLSSNKMKQLMADFHQNFDLVIYDVPPIVGLVDVRLIAPQTDGLVLVVRLEKTDKSALIEALDSLKISPINILGVVINGDKTKFSGYKNYYSSGKQSSLTADTSN